MSDTIFIKWKRRTYKSCISDPQYTGSISRTGGENAGDEEFSLNAMELPGTSLECFLKGLGEGAVGQGSPLYSELTAGILEVLNIGI